MLNNRLTEITGRSSGDVRKPLVVSFLSGKGGVGKSVSAYNLAVAIARSGAKCLVIDADWYFGNQHILGNFIPEYSFSDIIAGNQAAVRATITVQPNLSFIASPSVGVNDSAFDETQFARFLSDIRELFAAYDFIIIDTPSGLVNLISLAAGASDMNFIVLNPELTSLADAYGLFKYLINSNRKISVHLLINRVQNYSEAAFIYQKIAALSETFLGQVPFEAGYLLEDKMVIEAVAAQKSIFEIDPKGPQTERFLYLRNRLWKEKTGRDWPDETNQVTKINTPKVLADIKEE
ncbi:putative Site-determining protein [Candidatus Zixiibacteriota bacterium]|nr:putative Site-determining protein [candidate division Zixibacteria bacterium]